ncbi:MAG: 5-carboxymethyl-2-hydroxymuconate isomerase [Gammaproteobacteria bacterium]|jgi:2-keto-4-pentenoate hydratase/2-oxohepta-3-ene-1,7-dioic acid hydratase in catechol pathway|nr:5-carboxymethyl-2-hydroxymuconate isomerase [Gammaproteobacteria bacterium]|tara:strand:- start:1028 stop:1882 length:855 start_codon:yes stop_codon:yes gene_type:complete
MKLASFYSNGNDSYGVVVKDGIVNIGSRLGDRYADLRNVLEADALEEVGKLANGKAPDFALDAVTYLPPVTNPDMIICIGANYKSFLEDVGETPPEQPTYFHRRSSAQVGHNQPIIKPANMELIDAEEELAVIIGKGGRGISETDALSTVAGYAIFNEGTIYSEMRRNGKVSHSTGKNFDACGAFGPWMLTADEVPDPTKLHITHRLNGEIIQDSPVSDMHFSISKLISDISSFSTLKPGDVIVTGTPVGIQERRRAKKFLKPGDIIEMEISEIGVLRNRVEER